MFRFFFFFFKFWCLCVCVSFTHTHAQPVIKLCGLYLIIIPKRTNTHFSFNLSFSIDLGYNQVELFNLQALLFIWSSKCNFWWKTLVWWENASVYNGQLTCKTAVQFCCDFTSVAAKNWFDPFICRGVGFNCKLIISIDCNLIGKNGEIHVFY